VLRHPERPAHSGGSGNRPRTRHGAFGLTSPDVALTGQDKVSSRVDPGPLGVLHGLEDTTKRQTTRPSTPRRRSPGHTIARQQALAKALSAIPDTGDDWAVAAFIASGTDRYHRLESIFMVWGWHAGYRSWYAAVRAVARAVRGLEQSGLMERTTTRRLGDRPRRAWTLTDDGRQVAAALTGEEQR